MLSAKQLVHYYVYYSFNFYYFRFASATTMTIQLKEGQYFGKPNHKISFNGITITDTDYTHDYVDWHCHENPYFTFLLQGKLIEENKNESYYLSGGNLLFHNWQDFHRNMRPSEFTRGAHIEVNRVWATQFDIDLRTIEGSIKVKNPETKNLIFKIFLESKQCDNYNQTSIELLLMEALSSIEQDHKRRRSHQPNWLKKLEEIIYENQDNKITTEQVSSELEIHPVHLSRTFHKYFGITFGQYCREIRLNKAVSFILSKKHKLTDIAYLCNFYDQSHMNAALRKNLGTTPKKIAKIIG